MKPRRTSSTASLAAALLIGSALLAYAPAVQAVMMDHLGGNYGTASVSGSGHIVTLGGNIPITPGVVPPSSSLLFGAPALDLLLDVTGFTGVVNGAPGPIAISPLKISLGANQAWFNISNAELTQKELDLPFAGKFGLGFITATAVLDPELSTAGVKAELAKFLTGGALVITYNSLTVRPDGGGTAAVQFSPTASFTLTAIPEPSTVALATSGVLMFLGFMWQRRRPR
jgi:hypothetical protein